jgi:hypothetical protein
MTEEFPPVFPNVVLVFFQKTINSIHNVSSIVFDAECAKSLLWLDISEELELKVYNLASIIVSVAFRKLDSSFSIGIIPLLDSLRFIRDLVIGVLYGNS